MTTTQSFGPVKTTGFEAAASVPVGAVIERVYFVEPGTSGYPAQGEREDYRDALVASIAAHEAAEARNRQARRHEPDSVYLPLPERFSIDCRWKMSYPHGGGIDTVASRTTYDSIAEAKAHLDRIDRHSAPKGL